MLQRARPRAALLVLPANALALALLPGNYRERALSSFQPQHPFNADRLRLWQAGFAMWRDHPWTGVGMVDLKPLYLQYRASTEGHVHGHLHNNWVQIAATLGSLGLAAFAWLMVGCGRIAWAARRGEAGGELRALGAGTWGAFWAFQAMGLFEWNFGDVEVTIALYALLGAAAAIPAAASAGRALSRSTGRDPAPGSSGR
jgi:O-antigen ligase